MRTLQEKYNAILEGNFSKEQFRRDAVMQLPNVVSKFNSFEDMTTILKNRGMIAEAKKDIHTSEYAKTDAKPEDHISLDLIDAGIKCELDEKFGRLDVSEEDYEKAKATAIKNLSKNPLYYIEKDSDQMPESGEKMEKAKLNEEIQNIENDEQTKKRIAGLTTQLLQGADPRDETVKKYAISVKNDLKSGDASRMTQYKNISSLDDLKADMEQYLSNDVDEYKEPKYSDEELAQISKDQQEHDEEQLRRERGLEEATLELSAEDMEKLHKDGKITLPNGSVLHYIGKVKKEETQPRTNTTDYASTPEKREDGTYDISGMMREAEAVNTLADILKNKGTLDHLKKIERLRLKLIDGPFLQKNPGWKDKAVKFISYDAREGLALIDLNGTGAFAYPNELVIDTETTNMSEDARTQLKEAVKALIKKTLES